MKSTLLQMTQDILSSMSSDEVNSIGDSPEALQVAHIIRQKYFDIISRVDLTDHQQLFQLQPSTDPLSPVLMYVPDGISDVKWIKYFDSNSLDGNTATDFAHDVNTDINPNSGSGAPKWSSLSTTTNSIGTGTKTFTVSAGLKITVGDTAVCTSTGNVSMSGTVTAYTSQLGTLVLNVTGTNGTGTFSQWNIVQGNTIATGPGYLYVTVLPNEDFINMVTAFSLNDQGVQSFTLSDNSNGFNGNFTFYYKNYMQPCYCTVISNHYVIFDGYDNSQDDTLQTSKTMCLGSVIPSFNMNDSFIPDLSEEQFPLLLNEAKELAFFELKQMAHPLADREVQRGWSSVQKKKAVINRPTYFDELPGFGRKRGYYGYRGSYYTGFNDSNSNARGGLY